MFFLNLFVNGLKNKRYFNKIQSNFREVSEWLKELAWKASIPQKGIGGSNPFLSTTKINLIKLIKKY